MPLSSPITAVWVVIIEPSCAGVIPSARSTASSRPRSSCSASIAPRIPMNATPIASQYSTSVMMNVRSKISSDSSRMRALELKRMSCLSSLISPIRAMTASG